MESALKIYDFLGHIFGIHFMNRWLANVKRKIPGCSMQTKKHIEACQNILRNNNNNKPPNKNSGKTSITVLSKHKGGNFILRWMGDGISIFIEPAFKIDIEGRKTKNKSINTAKNSNYTAQMSASEDIVFKNEIQVPMLVKSESQKRKEMAKNNKNSALSTNIEEKNEKKEEKIIANRPALAKKKK